MARALAILILLFAYPAAAKAPNLKNPRENRIVAEAIIRSVNQPTSEFARFKLKFRDQLQIRNARTKMGVIAHFRVQTEDGEIYSARCGVRFEHLQTDFRQTDLYELGLTHCALEDENGERAHAGTFLGDERIRNPLGIKNRNYGLSRFEIPRVHPDAGPVRQRDESNEIRRAGL
jgi:hypothetical protein